MAQTNAPDEETAALSTALSVSSPSPAASPADWQMAMEAAAEEDGYLQTLGPGHWAFFAESGPQLLVTFEHAAALRARPGQMPAAWEMAKARGWSLLTILCEGETFFRAPGVFRYFDRLIDEAFFDDFDQVLFYGAGPCGYAAASFVVAAPGARALLIAPRATMTPRLAGWDNRNRAARRLDFTSRYGFAPDMTEGADRVWVIHDPHVPADAAHAALFRRPWSTLLPARHGADQIEELLIGTQMLGGLMEAAFAGRLTALRFAKAWRKRRESPAWLRRFLAAAPQRGRQIRALKCILAHRRMPGLERRLAALLAEEEAAGRG